MEIPTEVIALTAAVIALELYIDREQCADTVIRDCGRRLLLGSGLVRWRWVRWRGAGEAFFLFFWVGVDFGDQLQKFFGVLPDCGLFAEL
jgi:hypothetical protein